MNYFDHGKLDVYQAAIEEEKSIIKTRDLLLRIVPMLTKMVRTSNKSGQGHVHENHPNCTKKSIDF